MLQGMIDRIYSHSDFITRKKAHYLAIFCLVIMVFIPIIAVSTLVTDTVNIMKTMVSLAFIFVSAPVTLTLVRKGHYKLAATIMTYFISVVMLVMILTGRDGMGFNNTILYLYGTLIFAVFFAGRLTATIISAANIIVPIIAYYAHRGAQETPLMTISYGIAYILTYILALLLINTLQRAVILSQEATDQSQSLLGANNRILAQVRQQISSLLGISSEVAATSNTISQGAQKQAAGIEEIASSLEEMNAMVSTNADNASTVARMSRESLTLAEQGGTVVREAIVSINNINAMSGRIQDILKIINDIAFQTNLLALNAAVEAARAGEHGRGFAVVAGEVRNLAQRSGNSAKEIEMLIKDSIARIAQGTELVNQSGAALERIIESTRETGRIITEVSTSLDEQRHGIDQVNRAVAEIDDLTQKNASAAEELSAAAESLNDNTEELESVVTETGDHPEPAQTRSVRPERRVASVLRAVS